MYIFIVFGIKTEITREFHITTSHKSYSLRFVINRVECVFRTILNFITRHRYSLARFFNIYEHTIRYILFIQKNKPNEPPMCRHLLYSIIYRIIMTQWRRIKFYLDVWWNSKSTYLIKHLKQCRECSVSKNVKAISIGI